MAQPAETLVWVHPAGGGGTPAAHGALVENFTLRAIEASALADLDAELPAATDRQASGEAEARSDRLVEADPQTRVESTTAAVNLWASGEACAEVVQWASEHGERVAALVLEAPPRAPDADILARVGVPTLVVFGNDDPNSSLGRQFRAALPNGHLTLVYAAGAHPADERPQAFASLVSDFLARHERFIVTNRSGLLYP